jgi:hypothetical protein
MLSVLMRNVVAPNVKHLWQLKLFIFSQRCVIFEDPMERNIKTRQLITKPVN